MIKRLFVKEIEKTYTSQKKVNLTFYNQSFAVNIPIHKVLIRFSGIGKKRASILCNRLNFSNSTLISFFVKEQVIFLEDLFSTGLFRSKKIGSRLDKFVANHIIELYRLGINRAVRVYKGLPARGQRTRTNAKTARRALIRRKIKQGTE